MIFSWTWSLTEKTRFRKMDHLNIDFPKVLVILFLLACQSQSTLSLTGVVKTVTDSFQVHLSLDTAHDIVIPPNQTLVLYTDGIHNGSSFLVLQVHSQSGNLSLSSTPTFNYSTTKVGRNIGLLTLLTLGQGQATWYIQSHSRGNVSAVAHVKLYTADDPLPGGCNEVFNVENDPSVAIDYTSHWTQVWFQWANLATDPGVYPTACGFTAVTSILHYDVYVYYLQHRDLGQGEFRSGVTKMLTAQDVQKYGLKAYSTEDKGNSKSRVRFLSQPSQGAVYSVVVTRSDTGHAASYISSVTYACDFQNGDCTASVTPLEGLLALVFVVVGSFLLLAGHRYFKVTQALFGFLFQGLLVFILISVPHSASDSVRLGMTLTFGVMGSGLWLGFWHFCAMPICSVFLMGLVAGYLVAATAFFTPLGNVELWETEANYGMAFACLLLVFTVLLMAYTKVLSITSCVLVGSFIALMGPSVLLRSSLQLVMLNTLYHQTVHDFLKVKVVVPLLTQDIVLLTAWPVLMVAGLVFQFYTERNRPPFPFPRQRVRQRILKQVPTRYSSGTEDEDERYNDTVEDSRGDNSSNGERTALLGGGRGQARPPTYQSVRSSNQDGGHSGPADHEGAPEQSVTAVLDEETSQGREFPRVASQPGGGVHVTGPRKERQSRERNLLM